MPSQVLHHIADNSARLHPSRPAVTEAGGASLAYAELTALSDRVRDRLAALGVSKGDRVGVYLHKSADSVAAFLGILKCGAAYVPVDVLAPAARNAFIHHNCAVKAVLIERTLEAAYLQELKKLSSPGPQLIVLDSVGGGKGLERAMAALQAARPAPNVLTAGSAGDDLAYILYTSGSTGTPKGVMLSHAAAVSFLDWCSVVFQPTPDDIFSSHAPFHFDLSILDLYLALKHGAQVVLFGENVGKDPTKLAPLIARHRVTVWYSAPTALSLLAQSGQIQHHNFSQLRLVLFAGEVFPVKHLRSLQQQIKQPRYFNLYGPTETNVCTYYEIPGMVPEDRVDPYPIGKTCENLRGCVVDPEGRSVPSGTEGELCIAGPNVMQGYWGRPDLTAQSFLSSDGPAQTWYKTGDLVVEDADGNHRYVGRRDRMVKRRGHRVELGEIEACLHRHPAVREAAVVALPDEHRGLLVKAHLSLRDQDRLSLVELKTFCSRHLPLYMIPDSFVFHPSLPKTSTDKTDYQSLAALK